MMTTLQKFRTELKRFMKKDSSRSADVRASVVMQRWLQSLTLHNRHGERSERSGCERRDAAATGPVTGPAPGRQSIRRDRASSTCHSDRTNRTFLRLTTGLVVAWRRIYLLYCTVRMKRRSAFLIGLPATIHS